MTLATEGIGNREISQRLGQAAERVRQGSGFHLALEKCDIFPPMMLYMIASGEKKRPTQRANGARRRSAGNTATKPHCADAGAV